jgi:hypothetical protein
MCFASSEIRKSVSGDKKTINIAVWSRLSFQFQLLSKLLSGCFFILGLHAEEEHEEGDGLLHYLVENKIFHVIRTIERLLQLNLKSDEISQTMYQEQTSQCT